jgi:hypothetical protein
VFGRLHTCGKGPLQVCGDVGQVCAVPIQVSGREFPQAGVLQVGALLQTPAVPTQFAGAVPLQVPAT